MTRALYRLGGFIRDHHRLVILFWVALIAAVGVAISQVGALTDNNLQLPGTNSQKAQDTLNKYIPDKANGTIPVAMQAPSGRLDSSANSKIVNQTFDSLKKDKAVISAVSPLSTAGAAQLSKNGEIGYISLTLNISQADITEKEANRIVNHTHPATKAGFKVGVGGYVGSEVSNPPTESSEVIGLVMALIILLFTFGSAVAMGVPVLSAVLGLVFSMCLIGFLGHAMSVPTAAPTIAIMIGLGVGIDYSLFIVSRHLALVRAGVEPGEAVARATGSSGSAVVFAGTTVIIALCSLALAGIPLVSALGFAAAVAVFGAMLVAITLLPAILTAIGGKIDHLPIRSSKPKKAAKGKKGPRGWSRWAEFICRHPIWFIAGVLVFLAFVSIPVLGMRLGQEDNGQFPKSTQTKKSYDLMTKGFGAGSNGPLSVAMKLNPPAKANPSQADSAQTQLNQVQQEIATDGATSQLESEQASLEQEVAYLSSPAGDPRIQDLIKAISKTNNVASAGPAATGSAGKAAIFSVLADSAPSAWKTQDLVNKLRDDVIPKQTKGEGATAYVGGQTAGYIDLSTSISNKLPQVIGTIIALCFLVLLIALRSVVLPAISAVLILFSVGAAYGILTAVFENGRGIELVGLDHATPIVSYVPLIMFAILFGLSMDYQVFLTSRIAEARSEFKGDERKALIDGYSHVASVISAAAAIMVSVFLSFILNGDPVIKQFGLGLAVAILLDVALIRLTLMPALLDKLGAKAWWIPKWLDRVVPHIGLEDGGFSATEAAKAKGRKASPAAKRKPSAAKRKPATRKTKKRS
jgi:RND superfamily putative drug exporter